MMKKESVAGFLVGTFSVCAVAAFILSVNYFFSTRTLRRLQPEAATSQANLAFAKALLTDAMELSKRNPDVDRLLQSIDLKTNAAAGSGAAKPGSK